MDGKQDCSGDFRTREGATWCLTHNRWRTSCVIERLESERDEARAILNAERSRAKAEAYRRIASCVRVSLPPTKTPWSKRQIAQWCEREADKLDAAVRAGEGAHG